MISSDSIRYMARKPIKNTEEPLTVFEFRDFLERLIMGGCGNYKFVMISSNRYGTNATPTHYTLNGHDYTVKLDDLPVNPTKSNPSNL